MTVQTAPPHGIQHVFRWDLDKTYLRTEFDTWIDLMRTAIERPERKRTVPGAASLMRELRASGPTLITILSGSPEQMRQVLEAKLRLDGVQWDEFVLKPSLRNLLRFRLRALRDQVGYKLPALLQARARVPTTAPETLFGDDAEADALVYSLYADILGGRIGEDTLLAVMEKSGAYPDAIAEVLRWARLLEPTDPVRRIFIHLDRKSDPEFFHRYGPRLVPIYNYFQAALVLVDDNVLSPQAAVRLGASLTIEHDFQVRDLLVSAQDVTWRGHLNLETVVRIAEAARTMPEPFPMSKKDRELLADGLHALRETHNHNNRRVVPPVAIDYLAALADDRARWEAARERARRQARGE